MPEVIRVEHTDGIGMFDCQRGRRKHAANFICPALNDRHTRSFVPVTIDLPGLFISGTHYCAFMSMEHIQHWIQPREFKILFRNGYNVYLIEVSDCIGNTCNDNIIYRKTDIIRKTNISHLFKS